NSYRKISPLADGSLVRSTAPLAGELIERAEAPFAKLKYEAKRLKFEYLREAEHSEEQYLARFTAAEQMADFQAAVVAIAGDIRRKPVQPARVPAAARR